MTKTITATFTENELAVVLVLATLGNIVHEADVLIGRAPTRLALMIEDDLAIDAFRDGLSLLLQGGQDRYKAAIEKIRQLTQMLDDSGASPTES